MENNPNVTAEMLYSLETGRTQELNSQAITDARLAIENKVHPDVWTPVLLAKCGPRNTEGLTAVQVFFSKPLPPVVIVHPKLASPFVAIVQNPVILSSTSSNEVLKAHSNLVFSKSAIASVYESSKRFVKTDDEISFYLEANKRILNVFDDNVPLAQTKNTPKPTKVWENLPKKI